MGIADEFKNLSENIVTSYNDRVKAIGTIVKETQASAKDTRDMLKGFKAEHKAMASSLNASLRKNTGDIETYVKNMLQQFSASHAKMSVDMKKDLAKFIAYIVSDVAKIVNGSRDMVAGFHGDREKMAAHWQAMTAVLAKKRGGKPVLEAGTQANTVQEAVEKPKKKKTGRKAGK